ncbi:MAG: P-loop NTPase fold protein [Cetobacterium sp.]
MKPMRINLEINNYELKTLEELNNLQVEVNLKLGEVLLLKKYNLSIIYLAQLIDINKLIELKTRKNPIVFAIMGKSGSGKSTMITGLTEKSKKYYQVKSYTTRAERVTDPNDKNTHTFVDMDFWEKNKHKALATYHSPKGYISWVDNDCFLLDRINLYAIDSIAFNSLPEDVYGVYVYVSEETRKERYMKREQTLDGFNEELHLCQSHIKREYTPFLIGDFSASYNVLELDKLINKMLAL